MTDQEVLQRVQYALLEQPDGGQTWGSGLWTRDEVIARLGERQTGFLKQTLILVSAVSTSAVGIGVRRVDLPTDLVRIVSAVWHGNDGTQRDLVRGDAFSADAILPTWETTDGDPLSYHEGDPPTLQIEIAPGSTVAGVIDLLYVPTGTRPNGNGVTLILPDEFCDCALLYGVLADLLGKDGRGRDLERAAYCEQRVQLAVEVARIILDGWA